MWFDVVDGEHFSVALAMRALELRYPCPCDKRKEFPIIFDPSAPPRANPDPVSRDWLGYRFNKLMKIALGDEAAGLRSWHSWRVTLACSLRAAVDREHPDGRSLDLIKVFGRWRSDDAVAIYGRLTAAAYASHVSASLRADAGTLEAEHEASATYSVDPMPFLEQVAAASGAETEPSGDELPPAEASLAAAAAPQCFWTRADVT